MNYIGVDLHKKSITVCVMDQNRKVLARKTIACKETDEIVDFFRKFRPFKVVVEATSSYPWFVELVEPMADEVILANPKKLRVIAESTKKTDRLDAQVLTEFLVLDMIPRAYQPTPRQREHRALVRHRQFIQGRITSVRSKIHHILSNYNADRADLFSLRIGPVYFKEVPLSDADQFVINQLWTQWEDLVGQREAITKKIKAFIAKAPQREAEARAILKTAPGVGFVTAEVVLCELGDINRFHNAKEVCAYAGLVPAVRQSGGKRSKDLRITKEGSGLLRWALVESAWRLVGSSRKWEAMYSRLKQRRGSKRAIVAVARKLLCLLYAMLRTSTPYKVVTTETKARRAPGKRLVVVRTPTPDRAAPTQTTASRTTRANLDTALPATQTTTTETTPSLTTPNSAARTSTPNQTAATETGTPRKAPKRSDKTSTPNQTTTTETKTRGTTPKRPAKTSTSEQITTRQTKAPQTTPRRSDKTSTPNQTTTTETTAQRTTRKRPAGTSAPEQTATA